MGRHVDRKRRVPALVAECGLQRADRAGGACLQRGAVEKLVERHHPALRQRLSGEGVVEDQQVERVEEALQRLLAEGAERTRGPGHAFVRVEVLMDPAERGERREAARVAPGDAAQLDHRAAARARRTAAMVAFR